MKKPHDIEHLLARYMDGATTLAEEDVLARYFLTHDVPQEWAAYKAMFGYIEREFAPRRKRVRLWPWSAAAAVAAGLALWLCWPSFTPRQSRGERRQAALSLFPAALSQGSVTIDTLPEVAPVKLPPVKDNPDTAGVERLIIPPALREKEPPRVPFIFRLKPPRHLMAQVQLPPLPQFVEWQMADHDALDRDISACLRELERMELDIDRLLRQTDYSVAVEAAMETEDDY